MTKENFLNQLNAYLTQGCFKAANSIYQHLNGIGKIVVSSYSQLSEGDKEDIIAISINSAFKNLHHYDRKYSINTWFTTIVKNKAIDQIRKNRSMYGSANIRSIDSFFITDNQDAEPLQIADAFDCPTNRLTNDFLFQVIEAKIEAMPEGQKKTILRQYFIEQIPNSEIIRLNKFRKQFVNVVIFRFKENLRKENPYGQAA